MGFEITSAIPRVSTKAWRTSSAPPQRLLHEIKTEPSDIIPAIAPDASQRNSREDLIRIAEYYPAGLKVGESFAAVDAPFAPNAYRIENGTVTAGPGARAGSENIKSQRIIAHPDITYRLVCVDEELGIVVFRQDFGNTGSYGAGNSLTMFEAFKIYGGQIHAVEAFMVVMPENTPSGWPAYEVKKPK